MDVKEMSDWAEFPPDAAESLLNGHGPDERGEVTEEVKAQFRTYGDGERCDLMRHTARLHLSRLRAAKDEGGAHTAMLEGSRAVLGDLAAGHTGANAVLFELYDAFHDSAGKRRGKRTLDDEWLRAVGGGLRFVAGSLNGDEPPDDPCVTDAEILRALQRDGPDKRDAGVVAKAKAQIAQWVLARFTSFTGDEPDGICLADIAPKAIEWLWRGMLPLGKLVILDGDPGLGKSVLTVDFIARVTTGAPMPGTKKRRPPENVVIACAEDDAEDTIIPRLIAAGADLSRVFTFPLRKDDDGNLLPMTIPEDIGRLRALIEAHDAVLLIIDPITAYLSEKVNTSNDASVRRALLPLGEMAADTGCCAFMVRHLNKDTSMSALHRGGGSMAFIGSARSGLIVGRHPDDDELIVLAQTKQNLARAIGHSFGYRVEEWSKDPDIPVVNWADETSDIMADVLMSGSDARKDAPAVTACWVDMEELFEETDPWPSKDILALLTGNGHNKKTIERTRVRNEVRSVRIRDDAGKTVGWEWTRKPEPKFRLRRGGKD